MKKYILLGISAFLLLLTTAIPFCVLMAVKQPLDGAQKALVAWLLIVGYFVSYRYYMLYKEHKNSPETF
jgi:hypothetical protein